MPRLSRTPDHDKNAVIDATHEALVDDLVDARVDAAVKAEAASTHDHDSAMATLEAAVIAYSGYPDDHQFAACKRCSKTRHKVQAPF